LYLNLVVCEIEVSLVCMDLPTQNLQNIDTNTYTGYDIVISTPVIIEKNYLIEYNHMSRYSIMLVSEIHIECWTYIVFKKC
jgi:hypothetical protein